MGTEILKEQYNLLLNDQKNKLQRLRQKKQQQSEQTSDNNDFKTMSTQKYEDDVDNDLDINNDVFSKFDKLESMDSDSDNEPIQKHNTKIGFNQKPTASKNENKILIKKNLSKKANNSSAVSNNNFGESASFGDELRELKDENGRFRKLLAEKDYEINYLKKKMDNEQIIQGMGPISGDKAATKIVDLAKKNREVTALLESEKTKTKQMTKNIKDLETQLVKAREKKKEYFEDDNDNDFSDDEQVQAKISLSKENKELKEKLNQASHKMMEFKSQSECLKQDIKRYQKALEKEVGDNVDIKSLLTGNSSWKGRQQQIRILQNKLKELKEQISMMDARHSQMLDDDDLDDSNFMKGPKSAQYSSYTFNSMSTTRTNADSRQKQELKKFEKDRREQFEKLKHDSEALEADLNLVKEKWEASKSRNKVLANENKNFREQVKVLNEKGKHDNELIDALMKKQNALKQNYDNVISEKEKASRQVEDKSKESQIKSMQEKNTIDQLKAIIVEREKKVKLLESELESSNSRQNTGYSQTGSEFFLNSTGPKTDSFYNEQPEPVRNRPPSANNFVAQRNPSFIEREISSRASLRGSANQRPNSSGLSAKVIEQQKEQSKDFKLEISELTTLHKSSEIERVRLVELVKTFQKRIEELNEKAMDSENRYNEQRRRCVNFEKQIEKMKLQDPSKAALSKQKSLVHQQSTTTTQMDQYKIEELETSLLIQKDENDALKAALKSTLEAKEEDLRLYVEMLESTKRVFLDGLKQYRTTAAD